MLQLQDKVAIITGASSGIGHAAAKLFAEQGAKVVVSGRRKSELDALVDDIKRRGGQAVAVVGDVRSEETAESLVRTAEERFGGLDVAFNNAGAISEAGPVTRHSLKGWHETIDTNLTSAFLGAKHQIPAMLKRGRGSLIFTSTFIAQSVGFPGLAAYSAAKAGLLGLMRVVAVEYGSQGIRANALLCAGVDTPMSRSASNTPESWAFLEGLHALKRVAKPEEIAQTALYLASDQSSFITGTALTADGGASISRT
jgi:NAD(P)-dependent dehydrogenase (short-subunit alcohol dehydrogenase family)